MKAADFDLHMRLGGRWGRPAGRPAALLCDPQPFSCCKHLC